MSFPIPPCVVVFVNCPDESSANAIALAVIEEGLAACVNILPRATSVYRWQGAVESAAEIPLLIKTTAENYTQLERRIAELHPYDIPEIIALPIDRGFPAYLQWIKDSVQP